MGPKTHPIGLRTGITLPWVSRWNIGKKDFPKLLLEDQTIRRFIKKNYFFAGIPKVEIERTGEEITLVIHTARPGVLIGRKGKKLDEIKAELAGLIQDKKKQLRIDIKEINRPELDAQLVAESVREQLEKRSPFRRVLKKTIQTSMNAGARGVRIMLSGRLGGSEMARCEHSHEGSIPLSTLSADLSYGFTEAGTPYGNIGIKCWIYRGPFTAPEEK
jgi:small subunit ribosomal protein S3